MIDMAKKERKSMERERIIYNPFLPLNEYVPDGEPHVFGDRVYLYGSHDKEGGEEYCMLDYVCYSAPVTNLKEWRYEGVIYRASQDPDYSDKQKYIYAPDVVRGNDGRYYLYYCLTGADNYISVAVSDSPAGSYEYYGNVQNEDGSVFKRFIPGDPGLINDDGVIRLYFGWSLALSDEQAAGMKMMSKEAIDEQFVNVQMMLFGKSREEILGEKDGVMGANTVTLKDDMLTVASEPLRIVPGQFAAEGTSFEGHAFYEASSIRKIGDTYYFIYSPQKNNQLCYATSKYPDKDFVYQGVVISNCDVEYQGRKQEDALNLSGTNHGSIEYIDGEWYVFYHRLTHASDYSRQACAEKIMLQPDGKIDQVEVTSMGLNGFPLPAKGEYPAVIACNITNGKMPNIQFERLKITKDIPHVTHDGEEHFVTDITDGTLLGYKYFDFHGKTTLSLAFKADADSIFEISLDEHADGASLGKIELTPTTDWKTARTQITAEGRKPLYLRYKGKGKASLLTLGFCDPEYGSC
jgi:hypothetical protein